MYRSILLAGCVVAGLGTHPAFAQRGSDADTLRMIERLRPSEDRTRGIRMPGTDSGTATPARPEASPPATASPGAAPRPPAPREAAPPRETTAPAGAAAISLTVNFAPGSATLSPQAAAALATLGRALASAELQPFRFRIEGHTDTMGDAEMNMALSQRRAEAVRDFLMARFGVAAERLVASGLGETQLLVPTGDNVDSPRNRRVQVVNLGS